MIKQNDLVSLAMATDALTLNGETWMDVASAMVWHEIDMAKDDINDDKSTVLCPSVNIQDAITTVAGELKTNFNGNEEHLLHWAQTGEIK